MDHALQEPAYPLCRRVVVLHEAVDVLLRARAVAESDGHVALHREAQPVGALARLEVHFVSDPVQHVERLHKLEAFVSAQQFELLQVVEHQSAVRDESEPERRVVVAQPAHVLLDVGLRRVEIAVFGGQLMRLFPMPNHLQHESRVPLSKLVELQPELREHAFLADNPARLRIGGEDFGVLGGQVQRLARAVKRIPGLESHVPQKRHEVAAEQLDVFVEPPFIQHTDVEVGARAELAPPIAAQRADGHARQQLLRMPHLPQGELRHTAHDIVGRLAEQTDHVVAGLALPVPRAQRVPLRVKPVPRRFNTRLARHLRESGVARRRHGGQLCEVRGQIAVSSAVESPAAACSSEGVS